MLQVLMVLTPVDWHKPSSVASLALIILIRGGDLYARLKGNVTAVNRYV